MRDQLAAELLKLRTTRTAALVAALAVAFALAGTAVQALSTDLAELAGEDGQRTLFGSANSAVTFSTFLGLLAVTEEFRYGTIRPTLLVRPRRGVVLAAKLVVSALAGMLLGVVCVAVAFGAGLPLLAARDVDVTLSGGHAAALVFGTVGASACTAMLGVAAGALIRNQAGAIVAVFAYSVLEHGVLFGSLPELARYLPGEAGNGLAGLPDDELLVPLAGAAVMLAWTAALVAAAVVRTDRSDV